MTTTTSGADSCWYRYAENPTTVEQGQLLFDLTVGEVPERTDPEPPGEAAQSALIEDRTGSFAVATQTCDAERLGKLLLVAVSRVAAQETTKSKLSPIAKGNRPRYHLLPPEPQFGLKTYLICDFGDFVIVRKTEVLAFLAACEQTRVGDGENARMVLAPSKTLLLDLPFRENFGVTLGGVFSRVALEQNSWERSDFPGNLKPLPLAT